MDPSSDKNSNDLQTEINRLAERLDVRPMPVGLRTNDGLNIYVDDDGTYHYTTYERGKLSGTTPASWTMFSIGTAKASWAASLQILRDRNERFLYEYQVLNHYSPDWAKRRVRELAALFRDGQPEDIALLPDIGEPL